MDKKKSNITNTTNRKTIKVDEETHKDLRIYTATNKFKTMGDSIRDLLDKIAESNKETDMLR